MGTVIQDLRHGARMLVRQPGFTVIAVIILGLGIGANTAIFSLVDAFLLRLLPVKDPQQLIFVYRKLPKGGMASDFPYPAYEQFRDRNHSFAGMFAYDDTNINVTVDGQPEMTPGDFVSGSYFDVLGVSAILGRTLTSEDDQPGKPPAAVISYGYWKRRFHQDPAVLGKTIHVGKIPFTVIGVTSTGFYGRNVAGRSADVMLPMFTQPQLALKDHDTFRIMARLKPGVSSEQARADLDVIYQQALEETAGSGISPQLESEIRARGIVLKPGIRGNSDPQDRFETELRILLAVVGIALLIASVNVANLLLARAAARRKEIAVRLAVGAGRGRLIRQLLTESVLLAMLGGVLGLLFAEWGIGALLTVLSNGQSPIPFDLRPDLRILAFTCGVSLLTGILFGLVPALAATRIDLNSILKGNAGGADSRSSRHRLAKCLVVSQVALSLALLIGAGLLLRSLQQLYHVDTGFERERVLVMWVLPALAGYDHAKEMNLYREIFEKTNAIPGVQSATFSRLRLFFGRWTPVVKLQGSEDGEARRISCNPVGPRFFQTLGIGLLLGREFTPADSETGPRVAVISESMARKFFPKESPIGRRLVFEGSAKTGPAQIVGVVKDVRVRLMTEQPREAIYIPYTQAPLDLLGQMNLLVRAAGNPASLIAAIRKEVQSLDKDLPLSGIQTQAADLDEYLGCERSLATLLSFFGALALALASIGLHGTMAYTVSRRSREIGIRMALGARKDEMLWMVLRETLLVVAVGIAAGLPLAMAATRVISSMLFGVKAMDPLTVLMAIVVLLGVALVAGYIPARRAAGIDPMAALRYE